MHIFQYIICIMQKTTCMFGRAKSNHLIMRWFNRQEPIHDLDLHSYKSSMYQYLAVYMASHLLLVFILCHRSLLTDVSGSASLLWLATGTGLMSACARCCCWCCGRCGPSPLLTDNWWWGLMGWHHASRDLRMIHLIWFPDWSLYVVPTGQWTPCVCPVLAHAWPGLPGRPLCPS